MDNPTDGRKRFTINGHRFVVLPIPPKPNEHFRSCTLCSAGALKIDKEDHTMCEHLVNSQDFVCNSNRWQEARAGIPVFDTPEAIDAYYTNVALLRMGV